MNVAQIQMPKKNAWNAYQEYRKALGDKIDTRDRAIMEAYKALAKGKNVLNLAEVMKTAGVFEHNKLPKLAIIRADATQCFASVNHDGSANFRSERWYRRGVAYIPLPRGTFPGRTASTDGKAVVPLIPPQFRPAPSMVKNYFILWEAEWEIVPRDPLLLKHLSGYLYAVVAHWDLTDVERAVLGQ